MGATKIAPTAWADASTLDAVRPVVKDVLLGVPAFAKLSPEEQRAIANSMVKVATYMANPDGLLSGEKAARAPVARAQADDPVTATQRRLSQAPGQVGQTFQAGAVKQGVEQFGALVQKVDFPKFVGGLIENVFQAIVTSSLQQMRAYGELLANIAKTVDEFAQDNISENNARDWLAGKYPEALGVDVKDNAGALADGAPAPAPTASLTAKGDNPEGQLTDISKNIGLDKPVTDLSDPEQEARLVQGARLQMARARQQLLSSMVMLGINRIVITDGHIQAKVIFDMRAQDVAARKATASMLDQKKDTSSSQAAGGVNFGWGAAGAASESTSEHMTTVQSAVEDTSESKAEVKANLTGEVRVNFKSDYFPMEKMASPQMIAAIQGRAIPPEKPVSGA
jgi:hypothetical protein